MGPVAVSRSQSPGTAKSGRFSSMQKAAVMSAPPSLLLSTTAVACESPSMMRFRAGKFDLYGGVSPGIRSGARRPLPEFPVREFHAILRYACRALGEYGDGRYAVVERRFVT